ncbi:MAG: aspartate/glutamate racemase family protein [Reyranellaceae bacterium]
MPATLGILILDTRFPRLAGDIGNPDSFEFPVLYERLSGIGPQQAVREAAGRADLIDLLAAAAERLVQRGAAGISTSCGFLALLQGELAARCSVPVATSSLLQVPVVQRLLPAGKRVGIVTAEAASLTRAHLEAVGVDPATPVAGMPPGGAFAHTFLDNSPDLDHGAVRAELVESGRKLLAEHADIGAIVLECTNLPPYARALHEAVKLPVYDVRGFLHWFQAGLRPQKPVGGISL